MKSQRVFLFLDFDPPDRQAQPAAGCRAFAVLTKIRSNLGTPQP
jgi:hypothetical protein